MTTNENIFQSKPESQFNSSEMDPNELSSAPNQWDCPTKLSSSSSPAARINKATITRLDRCQMDSIRVANGAAEEHNNDKLNPCTKRRQPLQPVLQMKPSQPTGATASNYSPSGRHLDKDANKRTAVLLLVSTLLALLLSAPIDCDQIESSTASWPPRPHQINSDEAVTPAAAARTESDQLASESAFNPDYDSGFELSPAGNERDQPPGSLNELTETQVEWHKQQLDSRPQLDQTDQQRQPQAHDMFAPEANMRLSTRLIAPPSSSASLMAPTPRRRPQTGFGDHFEQANRRHHSQFSSEHSARLERNWDTSEQGKATTNNITTTTSTTMTSNGHQGDPGRRQQLAPESQLATRFKAAPVEHKVDERLERPTISVASWTPPEHNHNRAGANRTKPASDNKGGVNFSQPLATRSGRDETPGQQVASWPPAGRNQIRSSLANRPPVRLLVSTTNKSIGQKLAALKSDQANDSAQLATKTSRSIKSNGSQYVAPVHAKTRIGKIAARQDPEDETNSLDNETILLGKPKRASNGQKGEMDNSDKERKSGFKQIQTSSKSGSAREKSHEVNEDDEEEEEEGGREHHQRVQISAGKPIKGSFRSAAKQASGRPGKLQEVTNSTRQSVSKTVQVANRTKLESMDQRSQTEEPRKGARFAMYDLTNENSGIKTSEQKVNYTFSTPADDDDFKGGGKTNGTIKRRDIWNKLLDSGSRITLAAPEQNSTLVRPMLSSRQSSFESTATNRQNPLQLKPQTPDAQAKPNQIQQRGQTAGSNSTGSLLGLPAALVSYVQSSPAIQERASIVRSGFVVPGSGVRQMPGIAAWIAQNHASLPLRPLDQLRAALASYQQQAAAAEGLMPAGLTSQQQLIELMGGQRAAAAAAPLGDQMLATANHMGVTHLGPSAQMLEAINADASTMQMGSGQFSPALGSLHEVVDTSAAAAAAAGSNPSGMQQQAQAGSSQPLPAARGESLSAQSDLSIGVANQAQTRSEAHAHGTEAQMPVGNPNQLDHEQQRLHPVGLAGAHNHYAQDYGQQSGPTGQQQPQSDTNQMSYSAYYDLTGGRNSSSAPNGQLSSQQAPVDYAEGPTTRSSSPGYFMRLEPKSSAPASDSMLRSSLDVLEDPSGSSGGSEYERDLADLDEEFNRQAIFGRPSGGASPSSSGRATSDSMLSYSPDRFESIVRFQPPNPTRDYHYSRRPAHHAALLQHSLEQTYANSPQSASSNLISQRLYGQPGGYNQRLVGSSSSSSSLWPSASNSLAYSQALGSDSSDLWLTDSGQLEFGPLASVLSPAGKWRSPVAATRLNQFHAYAPTRSHYAAAASPHYLTLAPMHHHHHGQHQPQTATYLGAASEQPTYSLMPSFASPAVATASNSGPDTVSFTISPLAAAAAAAAAALANADKSRHQWTFTLPRLASALASSGQLAAAQNAHSSVVSPLTPAATVGQPTIQYAASQFRPAGPYLLSPVPLYAFAGPRPLPAGAAGGVSPLTSAASATAPSVVPIHALSAGAVGSAGATPTMLAYRPTGLFTSAPLITSFAYPVRLPLAGVGNPPLGGASQHQLHSHPVSRHPPPATSSAASHSSRTVSQPASSSPASKHFLVDLQFAESKPKLNNNNNQNHGNHNNGGHSKNLVKATAGGLTQMARNLTKKMFGSASQMRPHFAAPPANFDPVLPTLSSQIAISPIPSSPSSSLLLPSPSSNGGVAAAPSSPMARDRTLMH